MADQIITVIQPKGGNAGGEAILVHQIKDGELTRPTSAVKAYLCNNEDAPPSVLISDQNSDEATICLPGDVLLPVLEYLLAKLKGSA